MIEELLKQGLSEDEIVQRVMVAFGIGEVDARFMVGIVTGEITGDVIEVDENGNEVRPPKEQSTTR